MQCGDGRIVIWKIKFRVFDALTFVITTKINNVMSYSLPGCPIPCENVLFHVRMCFSPVRMYHSLSRWLIRYHISYSLGKGIITLGKLL
jgi:hypothetical protein